MSTTGGPVCYIHIGPPKTGSSSLQHCVRTNQASLGALGLTRIRLVTPDGARARDVAAITRAIAPGSAGAPGAASPFWSSIEAALDRGQSILISDERLCGILQSRERLDPLLAFFERRGCPVVVIAYVRDQPTWLNSWYVQTQKRLSGLDSFDGFAAKAIESGRVDPARYLSGFMNDARLRLDVVLFEAAARKGLEADFLARCGIATVEGLEISGPRNSNFGAKSVFVAQQLMRRAGPGLKTLPGYSEVYGRFKRRCHKLGWDETPYLALDQARYDAIRARFAEGNDAFARDWLGAPWSELSPPRSVSPSMFDPVSASAEERAEIEEVADRFSKAFLKLRGQAAEVAA